MHTCRRKSVSTLAETRPSKLRADNPAAPPTLHVVPGSRFGVLSNDDDGSSSPSPTPHQFSKSLTATQAEGLSIEERQIEVDKMKTDIEVLKSKKKERRAAGGSTSEEKMKR